MLVLPALTDIKTRRKKTGLSQTQLAQESGVSQSLIAKIESGKIEPSYLAAKKIFEVLDKFESKASLKASDIMNKKITAVEKNDKISKAVKLMKQNDLSQLPVFSGKYAVGSISEKSILNKTIKVGVEVVSQLLVGDVMEDPFPTVSESTPLDVLLAILQHSQAVIVTKKESAVGIVTKSDLLKIV